MYLKKKKKKLTVAIISPIPREPPVTRTTLSFTLKRVVGSIILKNQERERECFLLFCSMSTDFNK
jgi:hypothetical protein